jgi:hypothetical protein
MSGKTKPSWWPQNPYPETIFPMKAEEYPAVVPDPHQRTALSGMLGREFWDIASESILAELGQFIEDVFMEGQLYTPEQIYKLIIKYNQR